MRSDFRRRRANLHGLQPVGGQGHFHGCSRPHEFIELIVEDTFLESADKDFRVLIFFLSKGAHLYLQ